MKKVLVVLSFLLVASVIAVFIVWQDRVAADIYPNETLMVDETTRSYRIVIPHTLPKRPPILFAYHGTGDSTESMAHYSQLDQLASQNGFILVYPAARQSKWATTDIASDKLDANPDVRFFDQLLSHLSNHHKVDRDRVYVVGMSNGASFVQLLATARSNDIAATVAHSGPKPRGLASANNPRPIMLIVGEEDWVSSTIQSDAKQYRSDGHVIEFVSVPKLAHEWSTRHNTKLWNFLSQHSSNHQP